MLCFGVLKCDKKRQGFDVANRFLDFPSLFFFEVWGLKFNSYFLKKWGV
jgi:hypothetical protein